MRSAVGLAAELASWSWRLSGALGRGRRRGNSGRCAPLRGSAFRGSAFRACSAGRCHMSAKMNNASSRVPASTMAADAPTTTVLAHQNATQSDDGTLRPLLRVRVAPPPQALRQPGRTRPRGLPAVYDAGLLHDICGHCSSRRAQQTAKFYGWSYERGSPGPCGTCAMANRRLVPHFSASTSPRTSPRTFAPGTVFFVEFAGPFPAAYGGHRYSCSGLLRSLRREGR